MRAHKGPAPEQVVSASGRSDEVDGLSIVPAIDREISPVDGEHLTATVQLGHRDDRRVGPGVLRCGRAGPGPAAGPGEIVVQVHACALNYLDIFTREGMPGEPTPLPHITGGDVAGVVAEVGPGVATPNVGDRVLLDP